MTSALRFARLRIAWCIVGTAVYQVGRAWAIMAKKFIALKPAVQKIEPPAANVADTAATSPWM